MRCIKCNREIPEESVYCMFCGKKQEIVPKHRKRSNGSGSITKLQGARKKPWAARKAGMLVGTYATRSEAQKALERLTDVDINERFNFTFAQTYEMWHREKARELDRKSEASYALSYSQCKQLHDKKFRTIPRSEFQAAIITLEENGYSKSTCEKLRTLFTQLSTYAINEGIITVDRAKKLTIAAVQKSEREIFYDADIEKIKKSKNPAAQVALVLISCGCRPNELFKAPLDRCFDDHIWWGSKTKKGRDRVIPIGPDGIAAYTAFLESAREKNARKLIEGYPGRNHVEENFAKREWRDLMEEIGRPGVVPYSCRHTFIARSITAGMDLMTLESIVGHVDKETTKLYFHLRAKDYVSAVQKAVPPVG